MSHANNKVSPKLNKKNAHIDFSLCSLPSQKKNNSEDAQQDGSDNVKFIVTRRSFAVRVSFYSKLAGYCCWLSYFDRFEERLAFRFCIFAVYILIQILERIGSAVFMEQSEIPVLFSAATIYSQGEILYM